MDDQALIALIFEFALNSLNKTAACVARTLEKNSKKKSHSLQADIHVELGLNLATWAYSLGLLK